MPIVLEVIKDLKLKVSLMSNNVNVIEWFRIFITIQHQEQENNLQYAKDWFNINNVASENQISIVVLHRDTDSHLRHQGTVKFCIL